MRWAEYGLNALTFCLVGLTLVLVGVALLAGDRFPRWLGAWAAVGGLTYMARGLVVAYRGFAHSSTGLIALIVFGSWAAVMAVFMWRRAAKSPKETTAPPLETAARTEVQVGGPAAQ